MGIGGFQAHRRGPPQQEGLPKSTWSNNKGVQEPQMTEVPFYKSALQNDCLAAVLNPGNDSSLLAASFCQPVSTNHSAAILELAMAPLPAAACEPHITLWYLLCLNIPFPGRFPSLCLCISLQTYWTRTKNTGWQVQF